MDWSDGREVWIAALLGVSQRRVAFAFKRASATTGKTVLSAASSTRRVSTLLHAAG